MRALMVAAGALLLTGTAWAQSGPELGRTATPLGGPTETVGARSGWQQLRDGNGHMSERDYQAQLAAQITAAEALTGKSLTDRDRGRIRSAIQGDLIAWRRQYDPRRADYRAMRERWLVDEKALSAEGWAKQRLDWLRAQQQWILATGG